MLRKGQDQHQRDHEGREAQEIKTKQLTKRRVGHQVQQQTEARKHKGSIKLTYTNYYIIDNA